MLAIGRGLMLGPKLLILDEPSFGIAPKLAMEIFKKIKEINNSGMPILLVEQRLEDTLKLVNRAYVIQTGRIVIEGSGKELLKSNEVRKAYLGI
jgi:branched-chain amino acid transport system ATP-binding protein